MINVLKINRGLLPYMDIEKFGKSSILYARCRFKIALVDLTGPAALVQRQNAVL